MPVLSERLIAPSSSDPMALVAVYNGESVRDCAIIIRRGRLEN